MRAVKQQHENVVAFATRQWLDIFSPSNFLTTKPVVLKATVQQGGQNLRKGMRNLVEQGHTGFCMSCPPAYQDRDLGMADYRQQEIAAARAAVIAIVGKPRVPAWAIVFAVSWFITGQPPW